MIQDQPTILIIDDMLSHADGLAAELADEPLRVLTTTPDDIDLGLVESAQLIVVDHRIDDWPQRDGVANPGLRPMNGLALIEVLRSHITESGGDGPLPSPGFVLWSADRRAFPEVELQYGDQPDHLVARLTNTDWFVLKGNESRGNRPRTLAALAQGFAALPTTWPTESEAAFYGLLALGEEEPWELNAREDVTRCFPPLHGDLAQVGRRRGNATPFVRWLLHRVLPYPTCLWPLQYVAGHLRVEVAVLRALVEEGGTALAEELTKVRYGGVFSSLLGDRWWRSGVTDLLWRLTDGNPFSAATVNRAVMEAANLSHGLISGVPVVPVLDERFDLNDDLLPVDEVVRVQLDEWPSYASLPAISVALTEEAPHLRNYVFTDDQHRLTRTT